jgi:hypothetical protein
VIRARVIDIEGVTWMELDLPQRRESIDLPAKLKFGLDDDPSRVMTMRTIQAVHERITGDGVHIYRLKKAFA